MLIMSLLGSNYLYQQKDYNIYETKSYGLDQLLGDLFKFIK